MIETNDNQRLYCLEDSDEYFTSLGTLRHNIHLRGGRGPGTYVVQIWSVYPPMYHFPTPEWVIEQVIEWAEDCGEVDELWIDELIKHSKSADVTRAAEKFLHELGYPLKYRMANLLVGTTTVTISEPLDA